MEKKLPFVVFLIGLFAFNGIAQTIPQCDCSSGCTMTIDTTWNNPITVSANQKLCITRQGVVNGAINVLAGGELCNSGTITGRIDIADDGTLCNDVSGWIEGTVCSKGYAYVYNNGTHIQINPPCDNHVKAQNFGNSGCSMYYSDVLLNDLDGNVTINGKTFIDGDFRNNGAVITVKGYLYIAGMAEFDDRVRILPGGCVRVGSLYYRGTGTIEGVGPGYGGFIVNGSSGRLNNNQRLEGMLDVFNKANPGTKPDDLVAGNIEPTVTFNTNFPSCGDTTRCDEVTKECLVEVSLESAFPSKCISGVDVSTEPAFPKDTGSLTVKIEKGSGPFTYLWSNGATTQSISGLPKGVYTVTVTNESGGCLTTATEVIAPIDNPYIMITKVLNNEDSPIGDTLWAYPTEPAPIDYQWYIDYQPLTGANKNYYVIDKAGEYLVRTVYTPPPPNDDKPCGGYSDPLPVFPGYTGVEKETDHKTLISVSPNPNKGLFNLYFATGEKMEMHIKLYSITGQQIVNTKKTISAKSTVDLNITEYPDGLYFLEVTDENGGRNVFKIIKQ